MLYFRRTSLIFFSITLVFLVICHIRYPFFFKKQGGDPVWAVGFGTNSTEFRPTKVLSPVEVRNVTDGEYIADPFLFKQDSLFYLFVEIMRENGDIAVFESRDFSSWNYCGIALDEPFHLSFPQVFELDGDHYMMPESQRSHQLLLYKAVEFPTKWKVCDTVLSNVRLKDPALINHNDRYYVFAGDSLAQLRCYSSDGLMDSKWEEHPSSPLGIGNLMRPAGRPFEVNGQITLPVQDRTYGYGSNVGALNISNLSETVIDFCKAELLVDREGMPEFLTEGVHHMDFLTDNNDTYFVIDGREGQNEKYVKINIKNSIRDNIYDLLTMVKMPVRIEWLE